MLTSVIIPVWNGEAVIADCLRAITTNAIPSLLEIICVDNASRDGSATLIAREFPQVRLLRQPVNLGFAGGVNQGMRAAEGDLLVLLNQDLRVMENWLRPLVEAFASNPDYGILGGTIFDPDGTVNHTGAHVRYPDARGIHETVDGLDISAAPREVDYVTGALFAVRRQVWEKVGPLDEGFYPAYYEEVDFCYRARRQGFMIMHVPGVRAVHHHSSDAWRHDPVKHNANQHFARYRFVAKHFGEEKLEAFFMAESDSISAQTYLDQILGALLGSRDVLQGLPAIETAREHDLRESADSVRLRTLKVQFGRLLNLAATAAEQRIGNRDSSSSLESSRKRLAALEKEENDVLAQIYFRHPQDTTAETRVQRWWRLFVLRGLSILVLRDYRLFTRLATLQAAHLAEIQRHTQLIEQENEQRLRLLNLIAAPAFYESR